MLIFTRGERSREPRQKLLSVLSATQGRKRFSLVTQTRIPLIISHNLEDLASGVNFSLLEVLPNLAECPFIREMLGDDLSHYRRLYVTFHDWPGESKDEWRVSGDEIVIPLGEFVKGDNDELAAIFVHELCHILLQDEIAPYDDYFASPEEQQAIAWSVLYMQYLGKDSQEWLGRTYPRMPKLLRKALLKHPGAFIREVLDPDFGTWDDDLE